MSESFRDLLLRFRARSRLTQRQLAQRVGVNVRSVQEWENGANYPSRERLAALIRALVEARGLTASHETEEAQALWATVSRDSPRTHAPFDAAWFARLLADPTVPAPAAEPARASGQARAVGETETHAAERRQDWGEAPDTAGFVGRTDQLQTLSSWVLDERCRLVAVLGMGGIGKTSLAARLGQEVASRFERVYWRNLRDAPPLGEWLAAAIGFLSDQQLVPPSGDSAQVTALLQLLRDRRCLLVLDNLETVLEPGQHEARYRAGMAAYGRLLELVGGAAHQSCLVLTSREAPPELAGLGGAAARTLELGALGVDEAKALLAGKQLEGSSQQWAELSARFAGNGLALKVVSERIRELFGGDIGTFLEEAGASSMFGGIRQLLAEQIERSSALEQHVLRVLAVEREPVRLATLLAAVGARVRGEVLEAVQALRRRSLIERATFSSAPAFTLQSVVLEYVTERLVNGVVEEIQDGQPTLIVEQPLIKAQARDYVRQAQERLIGAPILERLDAHTRGSGAEAQLLALLDGWRGRPVEKQGYGPGNIVNLLRLLRGELRGLDLSRLAIRQAYLAEVEAQDASLAGAELGETVLAEGFNFPGSVALSADGAMLASGTSTGQVWVWRVGDRMPLLAVQGHAGAVYGAALSADGRLLASGGTDGMLCVWDTTTNQAVATLQGHMGMIRSLALSADGDLLASGGADGTVRLWQSAVALDHADWAPLATLQAHTSVWRVALAADGGLLASVGSDGIVRLWDTRTGHRLAAPPSGHRPVVTPRGHTGTVRALALTADGHLLATGDTDGFVRLWETSTGQAVATLQGHTGEVSSVVLSADGQLVASSSEDGSVRVWQAEHDQWRPVAALHGLAGGVWGLSLSAEGDLLASGGTDGSVRLWETSTGRPVASLQGHTGTIRGVALSANGNLLASGGTDGAVRLWDTSTGQLLGTLHGHVGGIWSVALSADGRLLASGGTDGIVRLWETAFALDGAGRPSLQQTQHSPAVRPTGGRPLATLQGHTGTIRGVALCADGSLLASGGTDGMVRLWDTATGRPVATLQGHTGETRSVALSADGRVLASGGADRTVRVWDTSTPRLLASLEGHSGEVWGVALSADGRGLASGSTDGTVRLWRTAFAMHAGGWQPVATLLEHGGGVWSIALSADDRLLASGGTDGLVRLWDTRTEQRLATLDGHSGGVPGVALSVDGQRLATASFDGTVRLWATSTGTCLHTLRPQRRYERMDITGLQGATDAQRVRLLALGAVVHDGPADGDQTARDAAARRSMTQAPGWQPVSKSQPPSAPG